MNNEVTLAGCISSDFTYDHEVFNEKYYKITLSVTRDSGTVDLIPVIISERIINIKEYTKGDYIIIKGQYRSHNLHEGLKTRLLLFVFAQIIEPLNYEDNYNDLMLEGYITKPPTYRQTPLGREITDIMLAVPREYGKSDYIPCVVWGKNAKYVSNLEVGNCIRVAGRVQSRPYFKDGETKIAYEVSVSLVEITSDSNKIELSGVL